MDREDKENKSTKKRFPKTCKAVDKRAIIWNDYIKRAHGPAERKLKKAMNKYFSEAKKRYINRIKEAKSKKQFDGGIQKVLDYSELMAIYEETIDLLKYFKGTPDRFVNGRLIRGTPGAWQGVWNRQGTSSLRRILKMANIEPPSNIVFGQQDYADYAMNRAASEICRTTGEQVKQKVLKGLAEGNTLDDIAKQIGQLSNADKTFGYARARMIARTESTNAISGAHLRSFNVAETTFGLTVKKSWVANRDQYTRPEHLDLETLYGTDDNAIPNSEPFRVNGFTGQGPGQFGEAGMDINCRCTVVPVIS